MQLENRIDSTCVIVYACVRRSLDAVDDIKGDRRADFRYSLH